MAQEELFGEKKPEQKILCYRLFKKDPKVCKWWLVTCRAGQYVCLSFSFRIPNKIFFFILVNKNIKISQFICKFRRKKPSECHLSNFEFLIFL